MDSAPPQRRAMVMGSYYMLFQQLGGVAAPLLGLLASLVGIAATFSAITFGLAISSVIVLLIHRKLL
jgi:dipeptide/tripeptide permease